MLTDPIADLFTRIRNALLVKKVDCMTTYSKKKALILTVLKTHGYINGFQKVRLGKAKFANLLIELKYFNQRSVINGLKVLSKPGLKLYSQAAKLPSINNNLGILLVSTSQGVLTGQEARKAHLGGKLLAAVW